MKPRCLPLSLCLDFAIRQEASRRRAFDAEKGPEFFEKRLGLRIAKRKSEDPLTFNVDRPTEFVFVFVFLFSSFASADNDLMFSFTQIDASDPTRQFRIALKIKENNYEGIP